MKPRKTGCLLILAVAVGAVGLFLYPAISWSILRAGAVKLGSNGRCIQLAIFDTSAEAEALEKAPVWPLIGQYKTSTDFFRAAITNKYVKGADFSFFGGAGIEPPEDPQDPSQFTADNNAWYVVVLPTNWYSKAAGEVPADTPFMFSRNFGFGSPPGPPKPGDTIADVSGLRKGVKPFGDKLGMVVTFGGSVKFIYKNGPLQEFNSKGKRLQFISP
jgi:hypothetical protein